MFGLIFAAFAVILGLGGLLSRRREIHLRSREQRLNHLTILTYMPDGHLELREQRLVAGSAVIGLNLWSRILAQISILTGGEVTQFKSIMDRGRRIARVRMLEQAPNSDVFVNCRLQCARLSSTPGDQGGLFEVLMYSTALTVRRNTSDAESFQSN